MTKNELAKELAVSEHLHLSTAIKAIDGFVRIIKDSLAKGEDVSIKGFGSFSVVHCDERKCVKFNTGETVVIPAHKTVKYKPGKGLKELINN